MRVLPAIDLRRGRVVRVQAGNVAAPILERGDAAEQAQEFAQAGAGAVHVVDLDAAQGEPSQWAHLAGVVRTGLRVQFGGGIRSMVQIQQLLDLGVDRVVLGTQGVRNPAWLREVAKLFPGRVVLSLDVRDDRLVTDGWRSPVEAAPASLAREMDDAGLAGILLTSTRSQGSATGVDKALVEAVRPGLRTPLWVSGGLASVADLEWLESVGAAGAIVGRALYDGTLDLADVLRRFPPPRTQARDLLRVVRPHEEDA